ncbi:MAG: hypothetical protein GY861_24235 [bacterium]|nr:hypothetical protein [bacterium]
MGKLYEGDRVRLRKGTEVFKIVRVMKRKGVELTRNGHRDKTTRYYNLGTDGVFYTRNELERV